MKKSLLLYLFILVILLNIFTYKYFSNELVFEQNRYTSAEKKWKESLNLANDKLINANYFSLEKNENAQNYFNPDNATKTIQIESWFLLSLKNYWILMLILKGIPIQDKIK